MALCGAREEDLIPVLHVLPRCYIFFAQASGQPQWHIWDYDGRYRICDQEPWPKGTRKKHGSQNNGCTTCLSMYVADMMDACLFETVWE